MANNYTIRSFGLNIIPQEKTEYAGKKVEQALDNLWEPVLDYLKENENVFNGDVVSQIEKYNMQTMNLGMEMRKLNVDHALDEKW